MSLFKRFWSFLFAPRVNAFFAGSRSIEKEAEKLGFKTWSTDWIQYGKINLVINILDITKGQIPKPRFPWQKLVFWFSPDCSTYSIAACSTHRQIIGKIPLPKTEKARQADLANEKMMEIILWFPKAIFFIENPRGLMRKMPYMRLHSDRITRHTITYCQYGDTRMKPTDIWTNSKTWQPRPMCRNGDKCHEAAPRGSKTGTQGLKGSYERSRIPPELCREILMSCKKI